MRIKPNSKNKRILILNYEFPPLGGGAGNATKYILREFAKSKNITIDLITSSTGAFKKEQFSENITIYYLDIGKKESNIHFQSIKDLCAYSFKAFFLAKKLLKNVDYNLIHSFFGIPCGYIAMKLKKPYIVSLRGSDVPTYNKRFRLLDKLIFKNLSKKIWQKAEAVIANSENLKKIALSTSPKQKIKIIPNGVDTDIFKPSKKSHTTFRIISTSRLTERKGIRYILAGFIAFNKRNPLSELIIAGGGNLKDELMNQAQKSESSKNIQFIGEVDHLKLAPIYQKADIFISASFNEGMSNSMLEAMASGLAVIHTETGGTKELMNEEGGIVIEKGSVNAIVSSLEKLYRERETLVKMKQYNSEKAKKLNWQKVANSYENIYNSID